MILKNVELKIPETGVGACQSYMSVGQGLIPGSVLISNHLTQQELLEIELILIKSARRRLKETEDSK